MAAISLRPAHEGDIDALLELEDTCFSTDQLARRNFRWMIRRAHATFILAEAAGDKLAGYVLVLYRRGRSQGRIYSIAVNPAMRGKGIAEALLMDAEQHARQQGCRSMRLEVRPDNAAAIRLYEKRGYRAFGHYPGFYEDGTDALRLEKELS